MRMHRQLALRNLLLLGALLSLAGWAAQCASRVSAGDGVEVPTASTSEKLKVRREGTQLRDEPGKFLKSGNRVAFIAADGTSYVVLENLNLERVGKVVGASPDVVEWFVAGAVTEYQGSNYLLLSHVRRKATTPKTPRGF
jgi:hypothetical protein